MKLKKCFTWIGLASLGLIGLGCFFDTQSNNNIAVQRTQAKTLSDPQDDKTTLQTVFGPGPIPGYVPANGQVPSTNDVITYLNSRVSGGAYADVINDIKIDSITGGVVKFSALPKSRKYIGAEQFDYTSNSLRNLADIFRDYGDDLGNSGNWDNQPTNKQFLIALQDYLSRLYPLNINQIDVSIASDANSLGGLNYSVQINAIPNSTVYTGSATIKYELNDTRKRLRDDFAVGVSSPFEWGQFSSNDRNKPSVLNTICSANNVDTQKISAYTYTLTYDTNAQTITLTVSNNPYYIDDNITFKYKVAATYLPFTYNWSEIQDPNKGNGVGWSYATFGKGGFTFIPIDFTNHTVYIIDASSYPNNSGITTKLEADNMIIGSKITDPNDRIEWTVTGLAGADDATYPSGSDQGCFRQDTGLSGSITLPSTIKYIGKNAFRQCSNITSLNLNEGLEEIYAHSCMTIDCNNLQTIYLPSTLSNIADYIFGGTKLSDIYLYRSTHIYAQYPNGAGASPFFTTPQYTSSDPRTGRIHVPTNLLNSYINSSVWQSWIGTKNGDLSYYTRQVFQPIQKLSDVINNTINLPTYCTVESMLSLLCYINNVDPDKIKNYVYSVSGYTVNGGAPATMTIKVVNNPYYYGSADVYWTKDSFSTFDLTYSELNGNGGWDGYTAGNMRFYIVDPVNKYVEFIQGGLSGGTRLEGTNVTIGNTITYDGVTYNVLGTYNTGQEENGLRRGTFNGTITIGNQIKIIDRCSFRDLSQVTSVIFEPNSTLAEIGGCATMGMTKVTSWDIPASVKTIQYGNFGQGNDTTECASSIIFRDNTMHPYYPPGDGTYNIFFGQKHRVDHTLRIYVLPELVNQYRNDPAWQAACGGLDNATMMILPIADQLIPPMTSASQDGYIITTNSENSAQQWKPWHAFDGVINDPESAWATAGQTNTTGYLRVEMPENKKLISYEIFPSLNSNFLTSSPNTWTLQGSNNGSSWTTLDSRTGVADWDTTKVSSKVFYISNFEANSSYKYYQINVTANNTGRYLLISELKLFGY